MDSLLKFIKESKIELNGNLNYCVVVYKTVGPLNREVGFVYKNLDEFKLKITDDIKRLDSMFGIDFQIWIFD